MDRRIARRALLAVGVACACLCLALPAVAQPSDAAPSADAAQAAGPASGDVIGVEGRVVDSAGRPLADVQVLLEASRKRFSLRRMSKVEGEPLRVPARTDDDGRFELRWTWDPHYNTFTIAVGLDLGREGLEILERRDLTALMETGSVPPVRLTVENAGYLRWLGSYLAGDASSDEVELFRDKGRPDRLRRSEHFPAETTWWYFADGESHRFVDGRFERVERFDPIPPPG